MTKTVRSIRLPAEELVRALQCLGGVRPESVGAVPLPADARVVGLFVEQETRSVLLHLRSDSWPPSEVVNDGGYFVHSVPFFFGFTAEPPLRPEDLALVRLEDGRVVPARVTARHRTDYGWDTLDAAYRDGAGVGVVTWPYHRAETVAVPLADLALLPELMREAEMAVAGKDRPPPPAAVGWDAPPASTPMADVRQAAAKAGEHGKPFYWQPGPDA